MRSMTATLHLLQFSDTHLMASREAELKGTRSYESLQQVLADACTRHWNAEALLLTGDLVHDDAGGYAHVRELFGGLGLPVYCLPGNHDDLAALQRELGAEPFHTNSVVDFDHWRLVMLDSVVPGAAYGALSAAELARLQEALASAGERHVLICLHHHPVRLASRWLDAVRLHNADEFFAIVDQYRCVKAISWGHVHQQFDLRRRGVRLLAVPSTCAQFVPGSEQFAIDSRSLPGYRRFALHADGSLETEVVRVDVHATARQAAAAFSQS
jgi:Icc protein